VLDAYARRKGVRPVESIHGLAQPDVFESDEELDVFLAHVRAERDATSPNRSASLTPMCPRNPP